MFDESSGEGVMSFVSKQGYQTMTGKGAPGPYQQLPPSMLVARDREAPSTLDEEYVEAPAPAPPAAPATPQVMRLIETATKAIVERLQRCEAALERSREELRTSFGLVGPAEIILYGEAPTEPGVKPTPAAKALRGRWLKLTSQRQVHGTEVWICIQMINDATNGAKTFWTPETTPSGEKSFERYDAYPRDI